MTRNDYFWLVYIVYTAFWYIYSDLFFLLCWCTKMTQKLTVIGTCVICEKNWFIACYKAFFVIWLLCWIPEAMRNPTFWLLNGQYMTCWNIHIKLFCCVLQLFWYYILIGNILYLVPPLFNEVVCLVKELVTLCLCSHHKKSWIWWCTSYHICILDEHIKNPMYWKCVIC